MHLLLTGGTGLIGRALCQRLLAQGHRLTVLSRDPRRVVRFCGPQVQAWTSLQSWRDADGIEAVINLAGEPIADVAWSARRQQLLRDSRVALTQQLVARMRALQQPPQVLLSGSAIGFYGEGGERVLDESAPQGTDFSAQLCADWEAAALQASTLGVRVALLRTSVVLSAEGGMLARVLPPFRLGLGARLGDGRQWFSWIHIEDQLRAMLFLLENSRCSGAYNLSAPQALRNTEFTQALARQLHRPARLVTPAWALRTLLGARASLLLGSQRVLARRLPDAGFAFDYPQLAPALAQLLAR